MNPGKSTGEYCRKVTQAYDQKAALYRETDKREKWEYLAAKMLSDHYLLHKVNLRDKDVLNIGCAPHPIDEIMYVRKVRKWVASDVNPNVLQANEALCREELHPDIFARMEFRQADALALPFADASFDVVIAMSSLEHIPNHGYKLALKEIQRVLRPGGEAVVTLSNKLNFLYYFYSLYQQRKANCEFGYEECIYPWTFRRAIQEAGLIPREFASTWWIGPDVYIPIFRAHPLKYFGIRMGYRMAKR